MFASFFALAAQSRARQLAFRRAVVGHLLILAAGVGTLAANPRHGTPSVFGQLLLCTGIVEGAWLLGWRLTQLPKSQAFEFLLVSPLRPRWVFVGEALVGIAQVGLVTMSGLPIFTFLVVAGSLDPLDLFPLLVLPFLWAILTGLILTTWAYESRRVRWWGQRIALGGVLIYLVVGVLAAENLGRWLHALPTALGEPLWHFFRGLHLYNPFGVMRTWLEQGAAAGYEPTIFLLLVSLVLLIVLLARSASRLQPHFHERHYQPALDTTEQDRGAIAERPLSWWAVRRVSEYSGGVNFWLAGGYAILYAAYTIAGDHWPVWMGRQVFVLCDRYLGIGGLATALVVLAAVPAAFQYGLWDANAHERCKRLELLLLTRLTAGDYWNAAAAAAWRRGRGYFLIALVLWGATAVAGQASFVQILAALAAGVLLWGLYFTLGFRAFAHGMRANGLGMLLTVGLPFVVVVLWRINLPGLAGLLPPGSVFSAAAHSTTGLWFLGPLVVAILTLHLSRHSLSTCDADLRRWYDQHHGQKVVA
jgi:hypothetical protein